MKKDLKAVLENARKKALAAIVLVEASVQGLPPYDETKEYTPKEREPYDAFSDRFTRAVEICIKFFRSYEYYLFTVSSDTYRDLLQAMEKQEMISSVQLWVDMRDVRNRIVHEYLPAEIKEIYTLLTSDFADELMKTKFALETIG